MATFQMISAVKSLTENTPAKWRFYILVIITVKS